MRISALASTVTKSRSWKFVSQHSAWAICLALPLAALLLHAIQAANLAGIHETYERWFLRLAGHTSTKTLNPQILLIHLEEGENESLGRFDDDEGRQQRWRQHHAALLRKLEEAGAAVVIFDLWFPAARDAATDADAARGNLLLAEAIRDVRSRESTRIVIGAIPERPTDERIDASLPRDATGLVSIRGLRGDAEESVAISRVLVATTRGASGGGHVTETLDVPYSLPLRALMTQLETKQGGKVTASVEESDLVLWRDDVAIRRIRCESSTCFKGSSNCDVEAPYGWARQLLLPLVPYWIPPQRDRRYDSVLAGPPGDDFRGKVVVVGVRSKAETFHVHGVPTEGGEVFGYQLLAGLISDLMDDTYPRRLSTAKLLAGFYIMLGLGAAARRLALQQPIPVSLPLLGSVKAPLALILAASAYLIFVIALYATCHLVVEVGFDLAVLSGAYYLSPGKPAAARRAGFR